MGVVFNCAEQGNCNLLVTKSCMGLITKRNVLTVGWLIGRSLLKSRLSADCVS